MSSEQILSWRSRKIIQSAKVAAEAHCFRPIAVVYRWRKVSRVSTTRVSWLTLITKTLRTAHCWNNIVATKREMPVVIESHTLAKTALFEVSESVVRFASGAERCLERIKTRSGPTVLIVPMFQEDQLILIREYCTGTNSYELVFPTGTVGQDETIEAAANRELREEVGLSAKKISRIAQLKVFPGHFDHQTYAVLAQDLYPEKVVGDEPEPIEVVHVHISDVDTLLESGEFAEARSLAALFLLERLLWPRRV